jgi:hypothetical protein
MREVISPTACPGCLDTRRCWVCLGHGYVERRSTREVREQVPCQACEGSAVCPHCKDPVPLRQLA